MQVLSVADFKLFDAGQYIYVFDSCNNYGFFKVSFHKSNDDIMEIIDNLWIDLNYGINKIINLCGENGEKIEGIYVFFVLMDLGSYHLKNQTNEETQIIIENKKYNEGLIKKLRKYNIDYLFLNNKGNIMKDGQIIKEIPFKLNLMDQFKLKIKELSFQKEELEEKYEDYFKKLYPKNEVEILYYNPINKIKLIKNLVLVHLFKDIINNYFEINDGNKTYYYNMNNIKISNNRVNAIEKKNKKNWKMNVFLRIN